MKIIKLLCAIKLEGISLPAFIALSIVHKQHNSKTPWVYIGETHGYFHSYANELGFDMAKWSYGAVGRILNVLTKRKLLVKDKDQQFVIFKTSDEGLALVKRIEAAMN